MTLYNLTIKLPQGVQQWENINIDEAVLTIIHNFETHYTFIPLKISNNIIANLIYRPMKCNKVLNNLVKLTRIPHQVQRNEDAS